MSRRVPLPSSRLVFTAAMVLLLAATLRESLGFESFHARLFPAAVSGVALGLALLLLVRELLSLDTKGKAAMDLGFDAEERPSDAAASVRILAWPIGLIVATYFFGIALVLVPFAVAYSVLMARMRWYWAVLASLCLWVLVIEVLHGFLQVTLPTGTVWG